MKWLVKTVNKSFMHTFFLIRKYQRIKTAKSQLRIVFVLLRQNNLPTGQAGSLSRLVGIAQTDFVVLRFTQQFFGR
jgi:hypothetical protein